MGEGMTTVTIRRIQRLRRVRRDLYLEFSAAVEPLEKHRISRRLDKVCHTLRTISGQSRFV